MELGAQIKRYRTELGLSQDMLAEKIYASRQSVSNWETGKTYPDIRSLLLLSELFSISLDQLVKGDIQIMKIEINAQDRNVFHKDSILFSILFALVLLLPVPLYKLLRWTGVAIYAVVYIITMYYAIRIEKQKNRLNIHTYREIVAFTEGKTLDEIEQAREAAKRPYQEVFLMLGTAIAVTLLALFFAWLL